MDDKDGAIGFNARSAGKASAAATGVTSPEIRAVSPRFLGGRRIAPLTLLAACGPAAELAAPEIRRVWSSRSSGWR
jgi:hypothetical protein